MGYGMNKKETISRIENGITNLERTKHNINMELDDAIEKIKRIRYDLLYGSEKQEWS